MLWQIALMNSSLDTELVFYIMIDFVALPCFTEVLVQNIVQGEDFVQITERKM